MASNYAFSKSYNVFVMVLASPYIHYPVVTMSKNHLYNSYITFEVQDGSIHIEVEDPKLLYNYDGFPFAPESIHNLFASLKGE